MLLLNAQNAYFPLACVFQKVLAKHCIDFYVISFFRVKQHTFFERTVVAAYDLKNCTMVHPISSPTAVTATLHI